jgi:hypothetical protein
MRAMVEQKGDWIGLNDYNDVPCMKVTTTLQKIPHLKQCYTAPYLQCPGKRPCIFIPQKHTTKETRLNA